MGVDRHGAFLERDVEHHVGGLAADAGQRFQGLAVGWNLSTVPLDQQGSERGNVLRLALP